MFSSTKVTIKQFIKMFMLSNTRLKFYDELSVLSLRFPPQFRLILYLLDPDPRAHQIRIQIRDTGQYDEIKYIPVLKS
jgi:hypothetical protein